MSGMSIYTNYDRGESDEEHVEAVNDYLNSEGSRKRCTVCGHEARFHEDDGICILCSTGDCAGEYQLQDG